MQNCSVGHFGRGSKNPDMTAPPGLIRILLAGVLLAANLLGATEEVLVAVASNFSGAARSLTLQFQSRTGRRIVPIFGSSGKHYAQIRHGAPFHAFLAADRRRPELLEQAGRGIVDTRFTYAIGQIALWSPSARDSSGRSTLSEAGFRHLAIANPKLAPYGEAARQALVSIGVWNQIRANLVFGENIAQTFHFVESRSADLGIVAYSQLLGRFRAERDTEFWLIPAESHDPIEQQAILLRESPVARSFLDYLKGESARRILLNHGYLVPK